VQWNCAGGLFDCLTVCVCSEVVVRFLQLCPKMSKVNIQRQIFRVFDSAVAHRLLANRAGCSALRALGGQSKFNFWDTDGEKIPEVSEVNQFFMFFSS
jgi:hypothetical protein